MTAPQPWSGTVVPVGSRDRYQEAVNGLHKAAIKTADELRKLVLFDNGKIPKTELKDFPVGKCDPLVQLALEARNSYLEAKDDKDRQAALGFFKAMKDMLVTSQDNSVKVLDMIQKERHHQQKIGLLERKMEGGSEPSDASLIAMSEGEADAS